MNEGWVIWLFMYILIIVYLYTHEKCTNDKFIFYKTTQFILRELLYEQIQETIITNVKLCDK